MLLWSILQTQQKFFNRYSTLKYITDFLLNACGILAATTVYASEPFVLLGLIALPAVAAALNKSTGNEVLRPVHTKSKATKTDQDDTPSDLPTKPFVTHYRGAMMVVTCVCILAVDFPIFPRRFAKTESLGTSLMDLGVGSFVFSAGVVSARQHLKTLSDKVFRPSFAKQMRASIKHSLPLLALGFIRLFTVKGLDYAEHVTEYGVHWNFFFTLALIPPFVALLRPIFQYVPSFAAIGYGVSLIQQIFFTYSGLVLWTITAPREDFVSMNREGLVSLPGYLAIFLCGYGLGSSILSRDKSPAAPESANDQWVASMLGDEQTKVLTKETARQYAIVHLAGWSVLWCVVYYFTTGFYGPRLTVSRRLGSMAYVVWVNAFNSVQLLLFASIEQFLFPALYLSGSKAHEKERVKKATSRVLHAFNRNGLAIFLVANLLTGLVNMSFKTVLMSDVPAMAILVAYMAILTGLGLFLDMKDITIRI